MYIPTYHIMYSNLPLISFFSLNFLPYLFSSLLCSFPIQLTFAGAFCRLRGSWILFTVSLIRFALLCLNPGWSESTRDKLRIFFKESNWGFFFLKKDVFFFLLAIKAFFCAFIKIPKVGDEFRGVFYLYIHPWRLCRHVKLGIKVNPKFSVK